jgi:hypothetical protein
MANDLANKNSADEVRSSSTGIALEAIKKIHDQGLLFSMVLFVVALYAVKTVLLDTPWRVRLAVWVAVLVFVCFMVYSLARRFIYKPKLPTLSGTATLGSFRDELENKSDAQLLDVARQHRIPPFSEDDLTKRKKVNHIMEFIPLSKLQPARDLSRWIALFTVLMLLFPLWTWYRARPTASEQRLRQYYALLDEKRFEDAWDLIHSARKYEIRDRIKTANDFAKTYETTRSHQNVKIDSDRVGSDDATYWVSYDVQDRLPRTELYELTERTVRELFNKGIMNEDNTLDLILDNLRMYFDLSQSEEAKIKEFVRTRQADFLFDPSFVSEVGRYLKLSPRGDYQNASRLDAWRHFIVQIQLLKQDGEWKIRGGLDRPTAVVVYSPGTRIPTK